MAAEEPELDGLLTRLHEVFADTDVTPAQQQLLDEINYRLEQNAAGTTPMDTLEQVAAEVEVTHPAASTVMREILRLLRNMGV